MENEYYWFSEQPKKQYELGLRGVRKNLPGAVYSCGVGAAMLSVIAGRAGHEAGRALWAKRALAAWKAYHREFGERFGGVLYEAVAWGAASNAVMMEKRLRRCASLARVPRGNHSLRWARRVVADAIKTNRTDS